MMMEEEATRHAVTIHTDVAQGVPNVLADRVQLQQALMNLMLNGVEATPSTGGELRIKSQLAPDGQLLVSISDTGVGIPPENLDRIFNAFFTTKTRGTGLGIADYPFDYPIARWPHLGNRKHRSRNHVCVYIAPSARPLRHDLIRCTTPFMIDDDLCPERNSSDETRLLALPLAPVSLRSPLRDRS